MEWRRASLIGGLVWRMALVAMVTVALLVGMALPRWTVAVVLLGWVGVERFVRWSKGPSRAKSPALCTVCGGHHMPNWEVIDRLIAAVEAGKALYGCECECCSWAQEAIDSEIARQQGENE
ncbi:MAG: hypothetical protein ACYCTI_04150 [Acidimicrobiales bacterium]